MLRLLPPTPGYFITPLFNIDFENRNCSITLDLVRERRSGSRYKNKVRRVHKRNVKRGKARRARKLTRKRNEETRKLGEKFNQEIKNYWKDVSWTIKTFIKFGH